MKLSTLTAAICPILLLTLGACTPHLVCNLELPPAEANLRIQEEFISYSATGEVQVLRVVSAEKYCHISSSKQKTSNDQPLAEAKNPAKNQQPDNDQKKTEHQKANKDPKCDELVIPITHKEASLYQRRGYTDHIRPLGKPTASKLPAGLYNAKLETLAILDTTSEETKTPGSSLGGSKNTDNTNERHISFYHYEGHQQEGSNVEAKGGQPTGYPSWCIWPPCVFSPPVYQATLPTTIELKVDKALIAEKVNFALNQQPIPEIINIKADGLKDALGGTVKVEGSQNLSGSIQVADSEQLSGKLDATLSGNPRLDGHLTGDVSGRLDGEILGPTGASRIDVLGLLETDKISRPDEPLELANVSLQTDNCEEGTMLLSFRGDLGRLGQIELYQTTDCPDTAQLEVGVDAPIPVSSLADDKKISSPDTKISAIQTDVNMLRASLDFGPKPFCVRLKGVESIAGPMANKREERRTDTTEGKEKVLTTKTSEETLPAHRVDMYQRLILMPTCNY